MSRSSAAGLPRLLGSPREAVPALDSPALALDEAAPAAVEQAVLEQDATQLADDRDGA